MSHRRRLVAAMFVLLGTVAATPVAAQTTAFAYDSQPGDSLGAGQRQTFTNADLIFTAVAFANRTNLEVMARSSLPGFFWSTTFASSGNLPLAPGVYENASRQFSNSAPWPRLEISSSSRRCVTAASRFQIYELVFGSAGEVVRFAADVEYHCEQATPAFFAAIRYNSTRASLNPFDGQYPVYALRVDAAEHGYVTGPGIDCGAGRTDCDEPYAADTIVTVTATPLAGYFLLGWVGDCRGQETATARISRRRFCAPVFEPVSGSPPGAPRTAAFIDGNVGTLDGAPPAGSRLKHVYLPGPPGVPLRAEINFQTMSSPTPASVGFRVDGAGGFVVFFDFRAPAQGTLAPGTYESFGSASDPSVNIWGPGQVACNAGGRFTIYEYTLVDSTVTAFAADVELLCATGIVTASIRYRSGRTSLLPFDGAYPAPADEVVVAPTIGGIVSGPGIDCGDGGRSDCREVHAPATELQLHAAASPGYQFVGWSGACSGGGESATLTLRGRQRCYAVFTPAVGSGAAADPFLREMTLVIYDLASPDNRAVWLGAHTTAHAFGSGLVGVDFSSRAVVSFLLRRERLVIGGYEDATEYPGPSGSVFWLNECFSAVARTRIYEATFNAQGQLQTFAADVEGRCGSGSRPRHFVAAVRYNATRESLIPFDGAYPVHRLTIEPPESGFITGSGINCGSGRTDCTISAASPFSVELQATPLPGSRFLGWTRACSGGLKTTIDVDWLRSCSAVFTAAIPGGIEDVRTRWAALLTDSEPGDPVGAGERRIWLDAEIAPALLSRSLARINVRLADGKQWWIYLEAPGGRDLAPGIYDNAVDAFGDVPGSPGIQVRWSTRESIVPVDGGGCPGPPAGRFVIHELTFASGAIASLAVDFEQRCTAGGPALRGSIRFRARRLVLRPFAPTTFVRPARRAIDFNADGFADLVWRHATTGQNAVWFMNGVRADLTTGLNPPGADRVPDLSWEIRAVGDLNDDGGPDLIWQHANTGRLAVWFLSGATRIATDYIYAVDGSSEEPDLDWKIVAAADMDADGHDDVLWRHRVSGAIRLWHMTGTRQWDAVTIGTVGDANWTIVGLADMNDDGLPDLIWQNRSTGALAAWLMRDASLQATPPLSHAAYDPAGWSVVGVGDLNRDTKPDLVWQNVATGDLGVWFMDGVRQVGSRHLEPPRISNLGWRIVGVR